MQRIPRFLVRRLDPASLIVPFQVAHRLATVKACHISNPLDGESVNRIKERFSGHSIIIERVIKVDVLLLVKPIAVEVHSVIPSFAFLPVTVVNSNKSSSSQIAGSGRGTSSAGKPRPTSGSGPLRSFLEVVFGDALDVFPFISVLGVN